MKEAKRQIFELTYRNLMNLNRMQGCGFTQERIRIVANSRLGWYARATGNVVNFIIGPELLERPNKEKGYPGLVNPQKYYLR